MSFLASLLVAPFIARFGTQIGVKFLYTLGAFSQSLAAIFFGFLVYANNITMFLASSFRDMAVSRFLLYGKWAHGKKVY